MYFSGQNALNNKMHKAERTHGSLWHDMCGSMLLSCKVRNTRLHGSYFERKDISICKKNMKRKI
jgi:hypothetical protein